MDVIAMHQAGFTNAVASLGTAFTGPQANLLKRYTNQVILTYDSDGAGVKAALRAIPILKEAGISVKILNLEPYKDPDEFMKGLGPEEFQKRIDRAENSFYFEISVLERDFDLSDPEEKTKFFNAAARKLLVFTEDLERNNYIEAIARKYGIRYDDLRRLVNQMGARMVNGQEYERPPYRNPEESGGNRNRKKEGGLKQAQKMLLTWLSGDESLFEKLKGIIGPDDFTEPIYREVAALLFGQYEQEHQVMPAKILNYFDNKEEQTQVADLFSQELSEELSASERERALNETVKRIKMNRLEEQFRTVTEFAQIQQMAAKKKELEQLHISL